MSDPPIFGGMAGSDDDVFSSSWSQVGAALYVPVGVRPLNFARPRTERRNDCWLMRRTHLGVIRAHFGYINAQAARRHSGHGII
jgi:hypothetical protein